jgi:hypothetical protein
MFLVMPYASARQHNPDPSRAVRVVAHVSFDGESSTDMAIQTKADGHRYLYVEHSPEQGVSILDLASPSEPTLVGSVAWPNAATTHIRDVAAEAVLLTEAENNAAATQPASQPSDPFVLWDTSQINSPKVVQRFANVSRVLADDRGYLYILNADGLWVISTPTAYQYQQSQPDPFQTFWVCAEYANEAQSPCLGHQGD